MRGPARMYLHPASSTREPLTEAVEMTSHMIYVHVLTVRLELSPISCCRTLLQNFLLNENTKHLESPCRENLMTN